MKNIAFISTIEGIGGTERSLISLLQKLPENKYNVDLILLGKMGELLNVIHEWINVICVENQPGERYIKTALRRGNILKGIYGSYRSIQLKLNWKRYKCNTMYQYVHAMHLFETVEKTYDVAVTWYVPNSYHTVYTLRKVKATRKVMWIHMDVSQYYMPFDAENVLMHYDKIYCVSKACQKSFDEKYPKCREKTEVFYNIIDSCKIIESGKQSVDFDFDDRFRIMTCGRIAEEKQPLYAINIVEKLLAKGINNFVWYFVGTGPLKEKMQDEIQKKNLQNYIVLVGATLNPYSYVSKGNLYIQMSIHESYCLTLAEALILGVPSISTNFPSAYEIVDEDINGYIVKNSWEEICQRIEYLFQNPDKYKKLKDNAENFQLNSNGKISQFIKYIED